MKKRKGKLLYTANIGCDMRDWERETITKVFAGTDCILALTDDGRVLQKTSEPDLKLRTQYWTRIKDISLSGFAACHAVGLVSDGTCLIAKRALRSLCDREDSLPFDRINNEVKSWKQIVQTAVSDSYFALDSAGFVHVAPCSRYEQNDYEAVKSWRDVRRIVTGPQNSVIGITKSGGVLCTGGNLKRGDVQTAVSELRHVADVCTTGSECEEMIYALTDGTVMNLRGDPYPVKASAKAIARGQGVFRSHFHYEVILLDENDRLLRISRGEVSAVFDDCPPIASFAVGDNHYGPPFVIAVSE